MICPNCKHDISDTARYCTNCGVKLGAIVEKESIATEETPNSNKSEAVTDCNDKIPFCFQMWFITIVFIFTSMIIGLPAIVLFVIRIVKYPQHRKKAWIGLAGVVASFIALGLILDYASNSDDRAVDKLLEAKQYSEAVEYVESNYDPTTYGYYKKLAEIYDKQKDYELAALSLLRYTEIIPDLSNISDSTVSKLRTYTGNVSDETEKKLNETIIEITKAKAKKESAEKSTAKEEPNSKEAEERASESTSDGKTTDSEEISSDASINAPNEPSIALQEGLSDANEDEENAMEQHDTSRPKTEYQPYVVQENDYYYDINASGTANDAGTIETFDYADKEAKKLINDYRKTIDSYEGHFVNLSSDKKAFSDIVEYKQQTAYSEDVYIGNIKNGKPNGFGIIAQRIHTDQLLPIYIGYFKDGLLDGYGVTYTKDGSNYYRVEKEANYESGKLSGNYYEYSEDYSTDVHYDLGTAQQVLFDYPFETSVYISAQGEYKNNKKSGKWIEEHGLGWADVTYSDNGKKAKGTIYYPDGGIQYDGEMNSILQYNGKGTLYRTDGSVEYKGTFKNGEIK